MALNYRATKPHTHTSLLFFFKDQPIHSTVRATPRNTKHMTFWKTYFEMGTTSSMSKPTRGLWFNCFTNPLSTTYLKKIHTQSEKKTEVSADRQVTATGMGSEQEHTCPTVAANQWLHFAGQLQPCNGSVYRMLQIIPQWSWDLISN